MAVFFEVSRLPAGEALRRLAEEELIQVPVASSH